MADEDEQLLQLEEHKKETRNEVFTYHPDVDGLRAVAVLAVLIYHLNQIWLPSGFLGVDIFFVISGYVVSQSILSNPSETALAGIVGFYARRMKRLTLALIAVLCVAGIILSMCIPPWYGQSQSQFFAGIFALIGSSNLYFQSSQTAEQGYFRMFEGKMPKNIYMHTWSLGVEEQFYVIFPFILLLAYGDTIVKQAPWKPPVSVSTATLGFVFFISFWYAFTVRHEEHIAFYSVFGRIWEFLAGALVLHMQTFAPIGWDDIPGQKLLGFILQVLIFVLMGLSFKMVKGDAGVPLPWGLLPVSGTTCFLLATAGPHNYFNRCLSHWIPVYIGKLSYSIYLWHWPVFVLCDYLTHVSRMPALGMQALKVTLAMVSAVISYHCVEAPFRKWSPRPIWKVFLVIIPCMCGAELLLFALKGSHGQLFLRGEPANRVANGVCRATITSGQSVQPCAQKVGEGPSDTYPACYMARETLSMPNDVVTGQWIWRSRQ